MTDFSQAINWGFKGLGLTVIISLIIYRVIPHMVIITGMVLAITSIFLLALEDEKPT